LQKTAAYNQLTIAAPSIAEGMDPYLVPIIQTANDILLLILLLLLRLSGLFFNMEESNSWQDKVVISLKSNINLPID